METHQIMEAQQVTKFWDTLSPLLVSVLAEPESDKLINRIDEVVNGFRDDVDWEYGPSRQATFYFSLSPNLREDLMGIVDDVIAHAPDLPGWEFVSCKPRKDEVLSRWIMLNENNRQITVDTSSWMCVIYKFPDNTIDLDIKVAGVEGNLETQLLAVNIHLSNLLGERNYINIVKGVRIVSEFTEKDKERAIPVSDLYRVVCKYIPLSPV